MIDADPLLSYSTDPEALYEADDVLLLGLAHRRCVPDARARLESGGVKLPADLPQLMIDDQVPEFPALDLPPRLDRCAFCDRPEPTDEHVFPQWLSRELSRLGPLIKRGAFGPRTLRKIDVTAPVCETCNNRWLSVLENDARPVLLPLVLGEERRLSSDDQHLLAAWAAKTAMMLDLASGRPVIPAGFFHELRQRREALETHFVWIAAYKGSSWATWAQHSPLHLGVDQAEPPNAFASTFTAFHVVFQVVGHFTRGGAAFSDTRIYRDALVQISPASGAPIDWPPRRIAFDDEWLLKLAGSLGG